MPQQSDPPNSSSVQHTLPFALCLFSVCFGAELLRFITLCPARGLEQSTGEDIELHVLVSEEGVGGGFHVHNRPYLSCFHQQAHRWWFVRPAGLRSHCNHRRLKSCCLKRAPPHETCSRTQNKKGYSVLRTLRCDALSVTLALSSPSRQRRHVSTFGSRVLHESFPNKEKSVALKSAQHSLMQPQNYFTQVQNVEVVEVGSRGTPSEYYQLIRNQRGRMPGAQRLLVLRTSKIRVFIVISKQKQTRSEAEVCPPLRWAGTRAGTLGYRCTEHCCRTSPQSCCLGERHQIRKALSCRRLQNDTPILEYSP